MKIKIYIILALLMTACFSNRLSAQKIKAEVNRSRIFIGEQILLKLSVEQGRLGLNWFQFPDSVNHIEIVKRSKIDTVKSGPYTNYYQVITLTSFDSGRWQFPGLQLAGLNLITLPITIDVLPVDVSQLKDYHEIKEIEEIEPETNWLLIGIIATITLISIGMVYWFFTRKKNVVIAKPTLTGNQTPLQWALAEINKMNTDASLSPIETKKYYTDLNNISRRFFELQMNQNALQQTTDEWMLTLQPIQVDGNVKTSFFQFLRMSDSVRFAKFLPPAYENQVSVEVVKEMLQRVALLDSSLYQNYQPK